MAANLHLYTGNRNYSSWSLRALLVLEQSGLAYRETLIPLDTPASGAAIAAASPSARVPALVWNGTTVWDSLAIVELVAELAPEAGIWPENPAARALARSACAEMHAGFAALRATCPMDVRARRPLFPLPPAVRADVARIETLWQDLRSRFAAAGPYLFGAWSAADAFYAPVATRLVTYAVEIAGESRRYVDAVLAHPPMARVVREAEAEPWTISDAHLHASTAPPRP